MKLMRIFNVILIVCLFIMATCAMFSNDPSEYRVRYIAITLSIIPLHLYRLINSEKE